MNLMLNLRTGAFRGNLVAFFCLLLALQCEAITTCGSLTCYGRWDATTITTWILVILGSPCGFFSSIYLAIGLLQLQLFPQNLRQFYWLCAIPNVLFVILWPPLIILSVFLIIKGVWIMGVYLAFGTICFASHCSILYVAYHKFQRNIKSDGSTTRSTFKGRLFIFFSPPVDQMRHDASSSVHHPSHSHKPIAPAPSSSITNIYCANEPNRSSSNHPSQSLGVITKTDDCGLPKRPSLPPHGFDLCVEGVPMSGPFLPVALGVPSGGGGVSGVSGGSGRGRVSGGGDRGGGGGGGDRGDRGGGAGDRGDRRESVVVASLISTCNPVLKGSIFSEKWEGVEMTLRIVPAQACTCAKTNPSKPDSLSKGDDVLGPPTMGGGKSMSADSSTSKGGGNLDERNSYNKVLGVSNDPIPNSKGASNSTSNNNDSSSSIHQPMPLASMASSNFASTMPTVSTAAIQPPSSSPLLPLLSPPSSLASLILPAPPPPLPLPPPSLPLSTSPSPLQITSSPSPSIASLPPAAAATAAALLPSLPPAYSRKMAPNFWAYSGGPLVAPTRRTDEIRISINSLYNALESRGEK